MANDCKLLVVSDQHEWQEQVNQITDQYSNVQHILPSELTIEVNRIAPDLVVLFHPENESSSELIQSIHENSDAAVVFLTVEENFELLRDIMRVGISEFLVLPGELASFEEKLDKLVKVVQEEGNTEISKAGQGMKRGRGKVYAFYSGKGGSGRTLLSTAYAQSLKLESTAEVLLIDLNLQFGGSETYLSIDSNRSLADLQPVMKELNEGHIKSVVNKEKNSQLEILLSPRDTETSETITSDFITTLIRASRRYYDFVVVDLPPAMNEVTYTTLEESDKIYYVINLDTPSLSVFRSVEDVFDQLHLRTEDRMEIVVNQKARDSELKVNDLKEFVHVPVATEVRRDFKGIQSAMNRGEALQKEANEKKLVPVAKDVRKWVLQNLD